MANKLKLGTLVRINKLNKIKSHFPQETEAIVLHSLADVQFRTGGKIISDSEKTFSLFVKGKGEIAWYNEDELTVIEENRLDLYKEWLFEEEYQKNLDMINRKYRLA